MKVYGFSIIADPLNYNPPTFVFNNIEDRNAAMANMYHHFPDLDDTSCFQVVEFEETIIEHNQTPDFSEISEWFN